MKLYDKLAKLPNFLTLNLLLIIILVYLCILYFLAISNYDLGYDEAGQVIWAKNFAVYGFPIITWNQINTSVYFFPIDNVQMLPMYLLSYPFFKLGLTDVWILKLIGTLASIISLTAIYYIIKKLYGFELFVVFLFLLVIQPGFGFVTSGFFSETMQVALLLITIYIWLKDNTPQERKKIILISLLFALTIHTKLQSAFMIILSLVIFHYTHKEKKSLTILFYTIVLYTVIAGIRFIPAIMYDSSFLYRQIKTYIFLSGLNESPLSFNFYILKINLFNRFFPIVLFGLTLVLFYFHKKTLIETFLYLYTCLMALWWIFLFPYTTYRHLMMAIIPFILLLSIYIHNEYSQYMARNPRPRSSLRLLLAASVAILMFYGFSSNILYAIKGNCDAVQFDLDGSISKFLKAGELRFDLNTKTDNSQKVFFTEVKKLLNPNDTLYNGTWVANAYLTNPMLPFSSVKSFDFAKYMIVGRDAYPLGLEYGYKVLDTLRLQRELVYKYGEFELYSVHK